MHRQSCPGIMRLLGIVCVVTMLVSPSAFGQPQPLRATGVHIEGVADTWRVTDKDGKIVEVHVPAQSVIDIQDKIRKTGFRASQASSTELVANPKVASNTGGALGSPSRW